MWRYSVNLVVLACCFSILESQSTYINRPDLMAAADSCLRHTYNFSFVKARQYQQILNIKTPHHPAPPFLDALILYWEHFPLTPDVPESDLFTALMDTSIARAKGMMERDATRLEGVFFDLFSRAFKAMYWADNGKSGKVVPDLRTMYNHTREGFALMDEFPEFYFSTGLYNYYIEAYPVTHPIYKPLVSFMQDGDRELGLAQLNHAIQNTVYLRVESMLFMSLIQLHYENDLNTAAIYAERLHMEYPANIYYQGLLVTILLHQHRYRRVREILERTENQEGIYNEMISQLAGGFMAEKETGDALTAGKMYQHVIELAENVGPFANSYLAMGYMGLSRLHEKKGMPEEARKYARKASNYTKYSFILEE
ncbi:MAG: hypothetical protein V2B15_17225 [Bacteroidota bacterium]